MTIRIGPVKAVGSQDSVTIKIYDISYRVFTYSTQTQSLLTVYSTPSLDGNITDNPPVNGLDDTVEGSSPNFWVGDHPTNSAWYWFISFLKILHLS